MSAGGEQSASGGFGCGTVLFFIFLTLKLTHYVSWSWWCVTAPLWFLPALLLTICAVIFICSLLRETK